MAKKQKVKDKTDLKDESIDSVQTLDEDESTDEGINSLDEESDENQNVEEKVKDLEEALLLSLIHI